MNIFKFLTIFCIFLITNIYIHSLDNKGTHMFSTGETLNYTQKASGFIKNNDGIYFKTIKAGNGSKAFAGETVIVHYTGWLINGSTVGAIFDSSHKRNQTFSFKLGSKRVILGWEIMVADMQIGEKRVVILPPQYAYGQQAVGNVIPANSTLMFEIELISAQ